MTKYLKIIDPCFLTRAAKESLYRRHQYTCGVPDVPTKQWSDDDWMEWIESTGAWWVVAPKEDSAANTGKEIKE